MSETILRDSNARRQTLQEMSNNTVAFKSKVARLQQDYNQARDVYNVAKAVVVA